MDKELIERLAVKAGFTRFERPNLEADGFGIAVAAGCIPLVECTADLQRFAALVAEECANVADDSDEYIGERIRAKFKP